MGTQFHLSVYSNATTVYHIPVANAHSCLAEVFLHCPHHATSCPCEACIRRFFKRLSQRGLIIRLCDQHLLQLILGDNKFRHHPSQSLCHSECTCAQCCMSHKAIAVSTSACLLDALWHLLILGAAQVGPIVNVRRIQSAGGDAGCAVGVLEGQVAQRTHERCLAGTSLSHYEEAGASPQNGLFGILYRAPFVL